MTFLEPRAPVNMEPMPPLFSSLQPYKKGKRYYNERRENRKNPTLRIFFSLLSSFAKKISEPSSLGNLTSWHCTEWKGPLRSMDPKITWMGHASVLIQAEEINLLFDPTYGFVIPCFVRHTAEPIPFHALPPIDVVAISHNHSDHFDKDTLKRLAANQPAAFVPHRLEDWFRKTGYEQVEGKKWWERSRVKRKGRTLTLTAIPARHWSQSNIADKNRSLWMGVMIEGDDFRIYFAGDTSFDSEMFEEIRQQFGPIDVALLPIAPEEYQQNHLTLAQSLDAFAILKAKKMIPIHYGAYRMGMEKIEEPLIRLLEAVEEKGLKDHVIPLPLGASYTIERSKKIHRESLSEI